MPFKTEADMQEWLYQQLQFGDLASLVLNPEILRDRPNASPQTQKLLQSFRTSLAALEDVVLASANTNISNRADDVLRPDFLLLNPHRKTVVVVELKNSSAASRQTGTEAGAYVAAVRSHLPYIAEGDIVTVIISAAWPTLLRHYAANEIIWGNRNIICLAPVTDNGELFLKIVDPRTFADDLAQKKRLHRLGGFQICLFDKTFDGRSAKSLLDGYVTQMRGTLSIMAARGNGMRSHGFAFLWNRRGASSPFNITVVHASPFKVLEESGETTSFATILKDLDRRFTMKGTSQSLSYVVDIAQETLGVVADVRSEGYLEWPDLHRDMGHWFGTAHVAFAGWGLFGELHGEALAKGYLEGSFDLAHDDPGLGMTVVCDVMGGMGSYDDPLYAFNAASILHEGEL